MKFQLSSEQKKEAYNSVKFELEKSLILRLSILGIDEEEFDEESFIPSPNSTSEKDVFDIIAKIKKINDKISKL
jgi:hypothetical protein